MNGHVAWVLELAVKPGELDNFKALVNEMIESTRAEPGTQALAAFGPAYLTPLGGFAR
jgi:quinol monooxygenase YgiN